MADKGRDALRDFHGGPSTSELSQVDVATRAGVAALLRHLRGKVTLVELARRSGHSRFAIARWLGGETEPRLPELLSLVEAATFRTLDFLACFTDIEKLPSAA